LHAGVALKGRGRARTRIKAFYFGERIGVLPAFGTFTGAHALQEQGQYFGIVENTVVAL
jgi:metallophosphoesterase superfamily enzyme